MQYNTFEYVNKDEITEKNDENIFFQNINNNVINFIKHKKEDLIKYEEYVDLAKKNINENKNVVENVIINNDSCINEICNDYYEEENEQEKNNNNYLLFSSDEDDDLENKISLKKKKIKYSGKKAKMIKSIKDGNDNNNNKLKNKNKKINE